MNRLAKYQEYRKLGWSADTALQRVRMLEKAKSYNYDSSWYEYRNGQRVEVDGLVEGDEIILTIDYDRYPDSPWDHAEGWGEVESYDYGDWLGNGFVDIWRGGRNDCCYKYNWKKALAIGLESAREYYPKRGKTFHMDLAIEWANRELKYYYRYCNDSWQYLVLEARLFRNGEVIETEAMGAVESDGWEDCADEIVATLERASKASVFAGATMGCV